MNVSLTSIRDVLQFAATRKAMGEEWTYIITGRPGPTGKTYLYNHLKDDGHKVFEISEDIWDLVDYRDNRNHFRIDNIKKQVVVVLNAKFSGRKRVRVRIRCY